MIVASFAVLARKAVVIRYTALTLTSKLFVHSSTVSGPRGRGPVKKPALVIRTSRGL